jgi:hypothetical protein
MDESQQLKQLISADLPSLGKYYREMVESQGAGVLVVNYYPTGEVAQMEARFLKSNQIPRLSRQMGLPNLETEFEQHDRQKEMVVAIVTAQTKGVVTVEIEFHTSETSLPETPALNTASAPESKAKRKSSARTPQERKSTTKTTTQRQAKKQPEEAATPKLESTSAKSTSKTSTSANQHKTSPKSTTKQKSQPKASPQTPSPISEERSDEPESETTAQPPAKRRSSTTASTRRKSSGGATRRSPTSRGARGKKQS